jgi:chromate transporter
VTAGAHIKEGAQQAPLRSFLLYFLRLGAFGFGGPIALAGSMQRDLVDARGWVSEQDYLEGLALAQLAPGPLAAQLAIYLGWVRARVAGATAVAVAFIAPSFLMVIALSILYVHFGSLMWMQRLFYGIGAAVIGIVARSAIKLTKLTLARDALLWSIFLVNATVTAWTEQEIVWLFVASGILALVIKAPPRTRAAAWIPPFLVTGLGAAASAATIWRVGLYFAEAGAFIFGSGLAIVPFLHGGVVTDYHWLSERQFLDAVAIAMITPGPVVITVAFIGYVVAGPLGATVAAVGVFLPCYLFVVIPAPYYRRFAQNARIKAFVSGVTAGATGAIAGAVVVLGRRAIVDVPTLLIALATLGLLYWKRVPEPLIIAVSGVVGLLVGKVP